MQYDAQAVLAPGTVVKVLGLADRPSLNGDYGRVIGWHEPSGRYMVSVAAALIRLKPSNVVCAVHILNLDTELIGAIFECLDTFRDRLSFRVCSHDFRRIAAEPSRWKKIVLADPRASRPSGHPWGLPTLGPFPGRHGEDHFLGDGVLSRVAFPRAGVEALTIRVALVPKHAARLTKAYGPFRTVSPSLESEWFRCSAMSSAIR